MITAHGGAMGTGRNTQAYFDRIDEYKSDAIEVDIWKRGKLLYLSHLPAISCKKKLTLRYAFEVAKEKRVKINCDLKQKGIIAEVIALAKEVGMEDLLIFTGCVKLEDSKYIDCGEAWFNSMGIKYVTANVKTLKEKLTSYNNPHFAGLNLKYTKINDEFLEECKKYDLKLSVFTIDDEEVMRKYAKKIDGNITTNKPLTVREIVEG
ncbi:MAG: glycerophosphodiester phosphodiesterase [Clostridiales bacterium]|nr:glycerophosphodiester phosphodiesterase [Clostridiales bacterium]